MEITTLKLSSHNLHMYLNGKENKGLLCSMVACPLFNGIPSIQFFPTVLNNYIDTYKELRFTKI